MKTVTKALSLTIMSAMLAGGAMAQSRAPFCGTGSQEMNQVINTVPDAKKNMEELEKFTKQFTESRKTSRVSADPKIVIPIVFHVIYDTKGKGNITVQQIMNALETINTDYAKLNADTSKTKADFKPIAAKPGFIFRIAKLDPQGSCTDGITRTESDLSNSAGENVKALPGAKAWDVKKYLNVWIVNKIASGAGGYAYLPGTAPAGGDGVLILNTQFGYGGMSNGDDGSVGSLTHEIGHYLNLKHTWGGSNTPGVASNCSDDDGVTDTPNTVGSQSCNLNFAACAGDPSPIANVQNYMDYSFCYTMFTEGQKTRMIAALNSTVGSRKNLWSDANLLATGTNDGYNGAPCRPVADFSITNKTICAGGNASFQDRSTNATPTQWNWSFPGGTPASSTDQNPTIKYDTPGTYTVTMISGNSTGADTAVKTQLVYVYPTQGQKQTPFADGFEVGKFTDNGWLALGTAPSVNSWEQYSNVAYTGTNCVRINNASANATGVTNYLNSPSLDFSTITDAYMTFKVAFVQKAASNTDVLRVSTSTNCGQSWSQKFVQNSAQLATAAATGGVWGPADQSEWQTRTVNLTNLANKPSVIVRFEFLGGGGNNIYIDDVNIVSGTAAVQNLIASELNMQVFPNPTNSTSNIAFNLAKKSEVTLVVTDVLGREVSVLKRNEVMEEGQYNFNLGNFENDGLYIVKMNIGGQQFIQKLMVSKK